MPPFVVFVDPFLAVAVIVDGVVIDMLCAGMVFGVHPRHAFADADIEQTHPPRFAAVDFTGKSRHIHSQFVVAGLPQTIRRMSRFDVKGS